MTCKDCLYYEVCPLGIAIKGSTGTCLKFKNKAYFVEVVRCKNCTHFAYKDLSEPFCMFGNALCVADYDDFCSYGTPKERGGEK